MKTPLEAVLLILSWEQLSLEPYRDSAGVLTWGWGHARQAGEMASTALITREAANELFMRDLAVAEEGVTKALDGLTLEPLKFGALVSFAFNEGVEALRESHLLIYVKAGNDSKVLEEFPKWVYDHRNGIATIEPGLVARRHSEALLWQKSG